MADLETTGPNPEPLADRWERALAQEPSTPEAGIYSQVGKKSWPYVDEPRPTPRRPSRPGPASIASKPTPKPPPLAPAEAVTNAC